MAQTFFDKFGRPFRLADAVASSWATLTGKPSSSPTDIDSAVSLKHTQGTDQGLDTGGPNAVTAAQAKTAYTNNHTHSNQSILDNIQEALTTALKSAYDGAVSNSHASGSDNQVASGVPFTPDGDIAAMDVQSAIKEVRDDTDIKVATKAGLPQQIITVGKANAQYTTIQGAIDSISDASTSKRYTVLVYPGLYAEAVTMKSFVNVVGIDRYTCQISIASANCVTSANDCEISNFHIYQTAGFNTLRLVNTTNTFIVRNCYITATRTGVGSVTISTDSGFKDVKIYNSTIEAIVVSATSDSALPLMNIGNFEIIDSQIISTGGDAGSTGIFLRTGSGVMRNCKISVSDTNASSRSIYCDGTGTKTISDCTLTSGGTYSIYNAGIIQLQNVQETSGKLPNNDGGTLTILGVDTDNTLAANSDLKIATQKAVKGYVDAQVINASLQDKINVLVNTLFTLDINALPYQQLLNAVADAYEDESGIDTESSTNESYDSSNDLYVPIVSDTDTKFLCHFDGLNGATTATDETGNITPITFLGNAQLSTTSPKFGTASLSLDGNSDMVYLPDSDLWDFAGNDFTMEAWVNLQALPVGKSPIFSRYSGDTDKQFIWSLMGPANAAYFEFVYSANGSSITTANSSTFAFTLDTWNHVAVVRSTTHIYCYINGTRVLDHNIGATVLYDPAIALSIGSYNYPNSAFGYVWSNGKIDETRISHVARYTSASFTPSSIAFALQGNMTLISNTFTATTAPSNAYGFLLLEEIDSITLNTDLTLEITRDGGTTWTTVTLVSGSIYSASTRIIYFSANISAQPSGTSLKYRIKTLNNKNCKISGGAFSWA